MEPGKGGTNGEGRDRSEDVAGIRLEGGVGLEQKEFSIPSVSSTIAKKKPLDLTLVVAVFAGWLVGRLQLPVLLLCLLLYLAWHQQRRKSSSGPEELPPSPRPRKLPKGAPRNGPSTALDFEECEWLSQVLGQVWAFYRPAWSNWVTESLTTSLNWYKPDFIQDFRIEEVDLGQQPRFELIKRHAGLPSNIIQLDVRTRQTDGLAIALSAKLSMGMRVPLALLLKSVVGDIAITIRLSRTWPYTAHVALRFMDKPDHQLVIKGLAGRFDLSQVPLLKTWLRQQVDVAVSSWLVENPIEFPLKQWYNPEAAPTPVRTSVTDEDLDDELGPPTAIDAAFPFSRVGSGCGGSSEPGCSGPAALLRVQVLEAADLPGPRTPYALLQLLGDDNKVRAWFQSARCEDRKAAECPWWGETWQLLVPGLDGTGLRVAIYNYNVLLKHELLGQVHLPMSYLASTYTADPPLVAWHGLVGHKGAHAGRVRLAIAVQLLGRLDAPGQSLPPPEVASALEPAEEEGRAAAGTSALVEVLHIRLVQAEISKKAFSLASPDSYCRVGCNGASWTSKLVKATSAPVFHEVHDFILTDGARDGDRDLTLQLLSRNLARADDVIGSCRLERPLLATCTTAAKNAWLELTGSKAGTITGRINVVVRVIHFQPIRHTPKA
ncbi:hypothetical protein KFL_001450030 [Klebsormidium nitens]|uniref:C2 domain-containing protein n=1 Tax=Klebsormidium nitens TaxID=105231 RepID=A0A1Y1HXG1_KLENI|nr:hypothetical protein KFL_001450030 [Klebsormidium nitens]|eukprot:GAQ83350.1 hypothetical protein KFL_001450030 [Klebsormidium nitens]